MMSRDLLMAQHSSMLKIIPKIWTEEKLHIIRGQEEGEDRGVEERKRRERKERTAEWRRGERGRGQRSGGGERRRRDRKERCEGEEWRMDRKVKRARQERRELIGCSHHEDSNSDAHSSNDMEFRVEHLVNGRWTTLTEQHTEITHYYNSFTL